MQHIALKSYPDAIKKLATLGKPDAWQDRAAWPDYRVLGISADAIDDLIRMVEDPVLNLLPFEETAVWAPHHAARALGQLGAVEVAPRLLRFITAYPDDDYLHEEMRHIMAALGPVVIPAIVSFVANETIEPFDRFYGVDCLAQIGKEYPEAKAQCVSALENHLARYTDNDQALNASLISSLIDLKATETIDTIRAAYAGDAVDIEIGGDLEDVEIELGLRLFRETPRPRLEWFNEPSRNMPEGPGGVTGSYGALNPYRGIGRNDLCPCGSGKKFKKCCLATL